MSAKSHAAARFASTKHKKMKKNVLIYGLISGLVVCIPVIIMVNTMSACKGNLDDSTSMLLGYASQLIAFSMVFVGTRNYRDKYNGGVISFGKAFQVGILIVLIASTMYVVAWLIDNYFFMPDFAENYSAHMVEKVKASGASPAEIAKKTQEMANFVRMYQNPFFKILMTYAEILPVGIVVTLISSLILKRSTPKQVAEA